MKKKYRQQKMNSHNNISGKNIIIGNNNIITDNHLLSIIKNNKTNEDLISEVDKLKQEIIRQKISATNKALFLIYILIFILAIFFSSILSKNHILALITIPFIIPTFKIPKYINHISSLKLYLSSADEIVKEIYKLTIIDKIKNKI